MATNFNLLKKNHCRDFNLHSVWCRFTFFRLASGKVAADVPRVSGFRSTDLVNLTSSLTQAPGPTSLNSLMHGIAMGSGVKPIILI